MTTNSPFHRINTVPKLILTCLGIFAVAFLLSIVAIWLLPWGEVLGNVFRAVAAVLTALLILGFVHTRRSHRRKGLSE
jgi:peptidoglycan/LPS O-acetylase OafA/YrhL